MERIRVKNHRGEKEELAVPFIPSDPSNNNGCMRKTR
jgi:hypothetical protein